MSFLSGALGGGGGNKAMAGYNALPGAIQDWLREDGRARGDITNYGRDVFRQRSKNPAAYVADLAPEERWGLEGMTWAADSTETGVNRLNELAGLDLMLANNTDMIDRLYNPQEEGYIDATMDDMEQEYQRGLLANNAAAGNSFGGSRHGVMDATSLGEYLRGRATVGGKMRKDAWDNAAGLAKADLDRVPTQMNAISSGLQGINAAGSAYGNLMQGGAVKRGVAQQKLDAPFTLMNQTQQALGSQTGASVATQGGLQSATPNQGWLGKAAGIVGTGLAAYNLSDVRLKMDIERLGDLMPGIGLYRFRYRHNPSEAFVGVLAQEVAAVAPHAVVEIEGGYLAVDMNAIVE